MAAKAYVLIETAVGKSREVAQSLKGIQGVQAVDAVTGRYDIIAVLEAVDFTAVGETVTSKIHTIGGILRTETCLSFT